MRELRTYGSVGAGGGKPPSATRPVLMVPVGLNGQIEFAVFPTQNRCFSPFFSQKRPISHI